MCAFSLRAFKSIVRFGASSFRHMSTFRMILTLINIHSLESKNLHEVREAYDITSLEGFFPDNQYPEFRQAVSDLVPKLCSLSQRLLRCLAVALGNVTCDC